MDKLKFYWAVSSRWTDSGVYAVTLDIRFYTAEENIRECGFERLAKTLDLEFCPHITTVFCKCGHLMAGSDIKVYKNNDNSYYVSRGI